MSVDFDLQTFLRLSVDLDKDFGRQKNENKLKCLKKMRKLLFVILMILIVSKVQSQISTSYYATMNFSKVSVGYNFNERLWGDLRLFGGADLDRLYLEPVLLYNFKTESNYSIYSGGGFSISRYYRMALVPVGVQIAPLPTNENIRLHFELQPTFNFGSNDVNMYYYVGLRYLFNKN